MNINIFLRYLVYINIFRPLSPPHFFFNIVYINVLFSSILFRISTLLTINRLYSVPPNTMYKAVKRLKADQINSIHKQLSSNVLYMFFFSFHGENMSHVYLATYQYSSSVRNPGVAFFESSASFTYSCPSCLLHQISPSCTRRCNLCTSCSVFLCATYLPPAGAASSLHHDFPVSSPHDIPM